MGNINDIRKKILDDEYSSLNKEQRDAVFSTSSPLLILAGAGSGKTTAIINKIGYLIQYGRTYDTDPKPMSSEDEDFLRSCLKNKDLRNGERYFRLMSEQPIAPENILAITFTNKAAGEMRDRLDKYFHIDGSRLWAVTFHSFCVRILRAFSSKIGYTGNFTIYDDHDSHKLIDTIIKKRKLSEVYNAKVIMREISSAKSRYISPSEFKSDGYDMPLLPEIYGEYQAELKKANAMDFDDLIFNAVTLLSENKDIKEKINKRFKYVLVDEYQDTNPLQYRLVSLLAHDGNLCVVGDDDQSIYRFMGASIENILSFEKQFTNAKTVRLEQNYRSTQTILDAANAVIANNTGRKGKNMWTDEGAGVNITVNQLGNQSEEGDYIARSIMTGRGTYGYKDNDFCVLYRTNAQSGAIESAFRRNGIPYKVFGGQSFLKRKEIQDILAYLNVICNPYDKTRLLRIINEPKRGIGDTTIDKIVKISEETGVHIFDIMTNAAEYKELARSADKLREFTSMLTEVAEAAKNETPSAICKLLIEKTHYETMLKTQYETDDAISRIDNIRELYNNIDEYEKQNENPTLLGYLENAALVSSVDNLDETIPAVTLMTMHCAKGLEFNVVFIAGFEEGLFPSSLSVGDDEAIEEERRLCYVALTRAKKQLYITSVLSRMLYGASRPAVPSRFLDEIPHELITEVEHVQFDKLPVAHQRKPITERKLFKEPITIIPPKADKQSGGKYKIGMKVKHNKFGEGTITNVTAVSSDTLLEVFFTNVGSKKLMANFAKLIIEE